jgi:hypothetical protein
LHFVVAADHGHLHPCARKISVLSDSVSPWRGGGFGETHLRVAAGENFAARIVHLQFHLQRARTGSTAPAVRVTLAVKLRPGNS